MRFFRDLEEYALLDHTETGEACQHLLTLYESYPDYISDEFKKELSKELQRKQNFYKSAYRIVEYEETRTFTVRDLEELV